MSARSLSAIYCDDIRQEIANKVSYMGVYSSVLVVESPIVLPKLCVSLSAWTSAENPFKSITFRILKDRAVLFESRIPEEDLERAAKQQLPAPLRAEPNVDSPQKLFAVGIQGAFTPFPIEGPCMLRIRAETESEEIAGPGLRIVVAPGLQSES